MAERDQNEGSGQQPPIGQNDDRMAGQSGRQEQGQQSQQRTAGQQGQQPLGQQGDLGSQEPGLGSQANQEYGQSAGQSSTGQASQDQSSDAATLSEGGQSGSESSQSDQSSGGGFVGSQSDDSGEYLQQSGSPESGFAEQGRGASNENRDVERSQGDDSESDNEGSSGGNI